MLYAKFQNHFLNAQYNKVGYIRHCQKGLIAIYELKLAPHLGIQDDNQRNIHSLDILPIYPPTINWKTEKKHMHKPTLSIVVAVYNESAYNLQTLVERLDKVITPLNMPYEVVFVNDGSREETSKSLTELCQQFDYIKLVNLSRNFGQQAAISAGMDFASGDAIVNMDSDLQDPPELIPDMVRLWQRGFEVIYAKRSSRKDKLLKQFTAYLFYRTMSLLSSIDIPKDTGEFRLIDRRVAKALHQLPERTRYIRGLLPWLGFKQTTIPIDRNARQHGESSYTLRKLINLALDGILCFSYAPLYAIGILGILVILSSLAIPLFWPLISGEHLTRFIWAVAGFVFLSGTQIVLLGIVSLYVARIFDEIKGRPVYIVSEIAGRPFEREKSKVSKNIPNESSTIEFDANPQSTFNISEQLNYASEQSSDKNF